MANTTGRKFGGRKKGTPNKQTKEIRDLFQEIIETNIKNIDAWVNEIAQKSPEKAIGLLLKLSEYVLPKLNRIEVEHVPNNKFDNLTDEELDVEINRMHAEINFPKCNSSKNNPT